MNRLFCLTACLCLAFPAWAQPGPTPLDRTLAYLRAEGLPPGLTEADLAELEITDQYTDAHNGVTHLYLRQRHGGVPLQGRQLSAHLDPDGRVRRVHVQLAGKLAARCPAPTPTLSAQAALLAGLRHLGRWEAALPPRIEGPQGPTQAQRFAGGDLSVEPIPLQLAYVPTEAGPIRLAWYLRIYPPDRQHWWNLWVDAETGHILRQQDWVTTCSHAQAAVPHPCALAPHVPAPAAPQRRTPEDGSSYLVYAEPVESPSHGPQTLVLNPADSLASPFGWHDLDGRAGPEFTYLRGNNAWSRLDRSGTNDPNGFSPDGGLGLDFRFDHDSSRSLTSLPNQRASLTNLFYWNNLMHDVWYHKGFTEVAGNFQTNNYGRGGVGGDFVIAEAQDGGGLNNANFATPPDGFNGRMQMYLWNTNLRDGLVIDGSTPAAGGYVVAPFTLGGTLPDSGLHGPLVLIEDSTGNHEGCFAATNPAALDGAIALIDRGTCNFDAKMLNAQAAGAIGIVLINNQPQGIFSIPGEDPRITIPGVMISQSDGDRIKASLDQGLSGTLIDSKNIGGYASDLDNGVIAHEYAHGISIRLTGGPSQSCLTGEEQAGEGWSDWFALVMTHRPGDQASDPRGIGTYVLGNTPLGEGIRRYPYTTDMTLNPTTYNDIRLSSVSVPHGVGSVMCTMLWDLYWALVDRYGYDPDLVHGSGGNHVAMQLVMDGLKLQPCSPGFVDVRDAILLADELAYGGANRCLIWRTFARRGLGYSAVQGSSGSRDDNEEAFDLPPICQDILYLAKETEQTLVSPGDTVRYRFVASNRSGSLQTNLQVQDSLPTALRFLPDGGSCTASATDAGFAFVLDDLSDRSLDTCTFAVLVDPAAPVSRYVQQDSFTESTAGYETASLTGSEGWTLRAGAGRNGTPAFFVPNVGALNDQTLTIPSFTPDNQTVFSFWHRYRTESGWDGGFVELQVSGDTVWQDLGPYFVRRGYDNAVGFNNPVGARSTFGGNSNGYVLSWADLGAFAGQEVRLRFRFVSDNNTFDTGWWLDEVGLLDAVSFRNQACLQSDQGDRYCSTQPLATYVVGQDLLSSAPARPTSQVAAWRVYPNPADAAFTLELPETPREQVQVWLLDQVGQAVWQEVAQGRSTWRVPVAGLSAGVYLLRVQAGERQWTQRVRVE